MLLLLYLAVQPVRWELHFAVSSAAGSGASGLSSLFSVISSVSIRNAQRAGACGSGVFIAQEVDGVEDKGSEDTTNQRRDTLRGLVENVPQISMLMLFSGFMHCELCVDSLSLPQH